MNYEHQNYPFPQVFLVDDGGGGGGGGSQCSGQPNLVPCWSYPPPTQGRARSSGKSRGCMGVGTGPTLVVLMLFLLVFAALGFEAYQIQVLQGQVNGMREVKPTSEPKTPQKQIGYHYEMLKKEKEEKTAAHVIGRIERSEFPKTLRWESRAGRAFLSGGVSYRFEDGGLQVNRSGLYHVYSRVELVFRDCSPSPSFLHSVFVRRAGRPAPLTLMEAHRSGFCSAPPGHAWTEDSYLASTLPLQKHDRVFVNVSQPVYLSHSHYANFFGLYEV